MPSRSLPASDRARSDRTNPVARLRTARPRADRRVHRDGHGVRVALSTGDGAVHEVGTRARVADVLEVLEDGRMNIIVEGGERFRLLELTTGRAFTTGIVEPLEDEDDPADGADVEHALELFGDLAALADSDVDVPDPSSPPSTGNCRRASTSVRQGEDSCPASGKAIFTKHSGHGRHRRWRRRRPGGSGHVAA